MKYTHVFVVYLTTLFQYLTILRSMKSEWWIGNRLTGLRKTTKKLSQDSRYPDRDLNPGPPKYDAEMLTTRPRHGQYNQPAVVSLSSEHFLVILFGKYKIT
jgi:hypothetical protein